MAKRYRMYCFTVDMLYTKIGLKRRSQLRARELGPSSFMHLPKCQVTCAGRPDPDLGSLPCFIPLSSSFSLFLFSTFFPTLGHFEALRHQFLLYLSPLSF